MLVFSREIVFLRQIGAFSVLLEGKKLDKSPKTLVSVMRITAEGLRYTHTAVKSILRGKPDLLCGDSMPHFEFSNRLRLAISGVSGASKTDFWPSFIAVIDVAIDKSLRLTFRLVAYFDDVL